MKTTQGTVTTLAKQAKKGKEGGMPKFVTNGKGGGGRPAFFEENESKLTPEIVSGFYQE